MLTCSWQPCGRGTLAQRRISFQFWKRLVAPAAWACHTSRERHLSSTPQLLQREPADIASQDSINVSLLISVINKATTQTSYIGFTYMYHITIDIIATRHRPYVVRTAHAYQGVKPQAVSLTMLASATVVGVLWREQQSFLWKSMLHTWACLDHWSSNYLSRAVQLLWNSVKVVFLWMSLPTTQNTVPTEHCVNSMSNTQMTWLWPRGTPFLGHTNTCTYTRNSGMCYLYIWHAAFCT